MSAVERWPVVYRSSVLISARIYASVYAVYGMKHTILLSGTGRQLRAATSCQHRHNTNCSQPTISNVRQLAATSRPALKVGESQTALALTLICKQNPCKLRIR
eukprot:661463-Pleurochrysis_carterae.AAC.4